MCRPDPPAKKIENVTIFWGKRVGPLIYSNTILIEYGKTRIIIDPSADADSLKALANQENLIVNSHYHGDHRRLNYLFTRSNFFAPEQDAPMLASNRRFMDAIGIKEERLAKQWFGVIKSIYNIVEHRITGVFRDNEYVIDRSYGIKAINLPGHTEGHSGFFIESASLTLITDIDLTSFGPWYGNDTSDIDAFVESIEKVKHIDSKYFMTSHTNRLYTKEQLIPLLDHYAAHIQKREETLLELIDKRGITSMDQLSKYGIIYPEKSLINNSALVFFEKKMLEKHLIRLNRKI